MKTHHDTILRPRITEKSALAAETLNAYVFEIGPKATKAHVAKAIAELYKVVPVRVNIVKLPSKKVISKGKTGRTRAVKKAYVYLKKGDTIEIL